MALIICVFALICKFMYANQYKTMCYAAFMRRLINLLFVLAICVGDENSGVHTVVKECTFSVINGPIRAPNQ